MQAVVAALRDNDRFVVTSHEAPDGDALGSLLGMGLHCEQLGKDVVMFLGGEAPLPGEYRFLELEAAGSAESAPPTSAIASSSRSTARAPVGWAQSRAVVAARRSRSTSTTTTTTRASATSTSSSRTRRPRARSSPTCSASSASR